MNGREFIHHPQELYCSSEFFNRPQNPSAPHLRGLTRVLLDSGIPLYRAGDERFAAAQCVPVDAETIQCHLNDLVKNLAAACPTSESTLRVLPQVALLPTGSFDAYAQRAPNGDPVCILDVAVTTVVALLSRALAQWVEATGEVDMKKPLVLAGCMCFAIRGLTSELSDEIAVDSADRLTSSTVVAMTLMSQAMFAFVLAHELAHHRLSHLERADSIRMGRHSRREELSVLTRSQSDELAADHEGMKIFLRFWDNHLNLDNEFDFHQIAPLFLFHIMTAAEETAGKPTQALDPARTHPAARIRADRLLQEFQTHIRPSALGFYHDVVKPFTLLVSRNVQQLRPWFES